MKSISKAQAEAHPFYLALLNHHSLPPQVAIGVFRLVNSAHLLEPLRELEAWQWGAIAKGSLSEEEAEALVGYVLCPVAKRVSNIVDLLSPSKLKGEQK